MSPLRVCGSGEQTQLGWFTPELCVFESLVVCEHEEGVSEDRGQKSAVSVSRCVWVNLGCGLGELWIGGLPPSTYSDAIFSPQTFIFTDSPDENLQERLGNSSAGVVVLHCGQEKQRGYDGVLGSPGIMSPAFGIGNYLVPRSRVGVRGCWTRPHSICCLNSPGRG